MKTFEECQLHPEYCTIKRSTIESINNYIEHGWEPGSFVSAVLANNLMESMGCADLENRLTIFAICSYVHNEIPGLAHGSYERIEEYRNNLLKMKQGTGESLK